VYKKNKTKKKPIAAIAIGSVMVNECNQKKT